MIFRSRLSFNTLCAFTLVNAGLLLLHYRLLPADIAHSLVNCSINDVQCLREALDVHFPNLFSFGRDHDHDHDQTPLMTDSEAEEATAALDVDVDVDDGLGNSSLASSTLSVEEEEEDALTGDRPGAASVLVAENEWAIGRNRGNDFPICDPLESLDNELVNHYGRDNVRLSRAYEGSGVRMRWFFQKLLRGEPVKIGLLGGSGKPRCQFCSIKDIRPF